MAGPTDVDHGGAPSARRSLSRDSQSTPQLLGGGRQLRRVSTPFPRHVPSSQGRPRTPSTAAGLSQQGWCGEEGPGATTRQGSCPGTGKSRPQSRAQRSRLQSAQRVQSAPPSRPSTGRPLTASDGGWYGAPPAPPSSGGWYSERGTGGAQRALRGNTADWMSNGESMRLGTRSFSRKPSGAFWGQHQTHHHLNHHHHHAEAAGARPPGRVGGTGPENVEAHRQFLLTLQRDAALQTQGAGRGRTHTTHTPFRHRGQIGASESFYARLGRGNPHTKPGNPAHRPSRFYETLRKSKIYLN